MLDEAESTLGVMSEDGSLFLVAYSSSGVGFSTREEQESKGFPLMLANPEEIDDILIINDSSGAVICLFSLIK